MERREKSKRWAPSEGANKALGLRLGTRLIKLTFSAEKLKKSVLTRMELPRCMKICGRFVWLILWWAQLGVFCFYVHLCWDFSVLASMAFAWFLVSCILRLVLGPVILLFSKRKPHYDPFIWLGYTVLFIVDFVLVFTLVEDRLNEERSPRPVIFEAVLCITPLLLLLLLNTADDNDVKRLGDFKWLCASMTLQVFDAIEMIDIVVSEKGKGSKIDKMK